jgi:hypothetical protein
MSAEAFDQNRSTEADEQMEQDQMASDMSSSSVPADEYDEYLD